MVREPSKGPVIQKRVKRLLAALLCFAAGEFGEDNFNIEYHWKEEDSANPKLTIKTTLRTLEFLTQKDKDPDKLTKVQIREALNSLKNFVKILEDNRTKIKGSDDWEFTLKLWSKDKEKNLKRFDEVWQNNRPKKSKELEANFTQDEGVAVVPQTKLAIFQAPPLPAHFVERPEYSNELKTRLLTEDNRTLVITAIHGLASVGKSTLAADLALDAEVQTRFCDGILWATLGQEPDVLSLLSGWVQALRDYDFKPTSVEATSTHLRMLLYDKAVLLVVDDAWNTQDAQAFICGGSRCQVLVTTREAVIADALAASTYNLDIMTQAQAMELLTKKLRREITGTERQLATNLAKAVGYLPLALELVAAEVATGTAWAELLADFQQEVARLKTLDRPEAEEITDEASLKRLSLTASLNLSVKRMPREKQQHFSWLGVLPEDVNINKMMATTLWEIDERDAAKTLQYLRNKALLLTGVPLADGTPTYRLHDLFHDLACNLLTDPPQPKRTGDLPGLGFKLVDAHAALLEKYRQKTQNNLWHTLPNDGYIHQHLVWHLKKAGWVEEIHSLLREESVNGNNGWYEAREKLAQTAGYITDVSHAWELAEASWNEATLSQVVGLQCRYALITASLNSLAANLPVELLLALVKNNLWTAEQGLAYALQNPEPEQKVEALEGLFNYLSPNLEKLVLSESLAAAKLIQSEYSRARILSELAEVLPPELLPEALTAAREIQDKKYRADALSALAQKLPDLWLEALAAATEIKDKKYRVDALSALAQKLPSELLEKALAAAREIQNQEYRADALSALAQKLPSELLEKALAAAREIEDEFHRVGALSALAQKLPPDLLPKALAAAKEIEDEFHRVGALSALAQKQPDLLSEVLAAVESIVHAAVESISFEFYRNIIFMALAEKLPREFLPEALAAARKMQNEEYRANTLRALEEELPPELWREALAPVKSIPFDKFLYIVLMVLAQELPPELLKEVLAAVREIQNEEDRANVLRQLAYNLPPELLKEVLAAVREIQNEKYRADVLTALVEKLPEVLPEALDAAREIQDERNRAYALSALAEKLPTELLEKALHAAREIQNQEDRANVLTALAEKLPEVLPKALAAAKEIQDERVRAYALKSLAKKLPRELLLKALAAAREVQDEEDRADALSALAISLLSQLLPQALAAARSIQDEYDRARRAPALSALAEKLPTELLPEALAAARKSQFIGFGSNDLRVLVEKLSPEFLPEALTAARSIQDENSRADALSALAEKLPTELLPKELAAARPIQSEYSRADVLRALALGLSQVPSATLFPLWREILHELSLRTRPNLLQDIKALFPVIFALGGEVATAEVARAIADVARWWR